MIDYLRIFSIWDLHRRSATHFVSIELKPVAPADLLSVFPAHCPCKRHNRRLNRTCCLHERPVEAEGEKRLLEAPQEVLEEASDGVDVIHLAEHGHAFAPQELFLQLLDGAIGTRQTVQSSLTREKRQPFRI